MPIVFLQTVRRPIVPTDWARFHHHAKRIQILNLPDSESRLPIVDESVYRVLALSKQTPLIPNLRSLTWGHSRGLEYIRLFIGCNTRRINLLLDSLDMAEQSLLCSLPILLPDLVQITINSVGIRETAALNAIVATLSNVVCGYSRLRCASFPVPLTREALLHLRDMPVLHDLTLTISEDNENFRYLAHPSCPPFTALRLLSISCPNISSSTMFLNAIPWHQIESVDVDIADDLEPATNIKAFFQTLRAQCSNRLESIQITYYGWPPTPPADDCIIDEDMFSPLLSFQHLTSLTILTIHAFNIGNDTLQKMAMSWPRLQKLKLGSNGWDRGSEITLAGLVPLVQRCVELTDLSIVVNATIIDPPIHIPMPNIKLRYLDLRGSKIWNPDSAAAYLYRLFPGVTISF